MQSSFDHIVQHLFHQPSLHSVTVDELEHMAAQHPYFAAAHFLLLKKMQDTDHPQFARQLHKTTIYFNNPLWLQFLLQSGGVTGFAVSAEPPFVGSENGKNGTHLAPAVKPHEVVTTPATEEPAWVEPSQQEKQADASPDEIHAVAHTEQISIMDIISDVFHDANPLYDAVPADNSILPAEQIAMAEETDQPTAISSEEPATAMQPEAVTEPTAEQTAEAPVAEQLPEHDTQAEAPASTFYQPNTNEKEETREAVAAVNNEMPALTEADQPAEQQEAPLIESIQQGDTETSPPDEAMVTESIDTIPPVPQEFPETADEADATEPTQVHDAEIPPLKTIIEMPAAKHDLLFEPYHTIDYFASQGIKLGKQEAGEKDKFGRQLKSFTEWLKTMKKLPQASIDKILAENEESKVVADASHSLEGKEVVTEAMAEVFEKQGLKEKAAEVYQKLSLLNPAKSTYFAARIEDLKH